jgi:hypothetical protein
MPLQYKWPGFFGKAVLLGLSLIILASDNAIVGLLLGALAILNLFLVYKLDQFSRQEVWLAHELDMTRTREQLLAAQRRVAELEASATATETGRRHDALTPPVSQASEEKP